MEERHKNRIQDNLSFLVKVRNSSDYEQISILGFTCRTQITIVSDQSW